MAWHDVIRQQSRRVIGGLRDPVKRGHVVARIVEEMAGPLFLSGAGQWLWRKHLERLAERPRAAHRVAVLAHVYYPDLLDEILACWRACPPGTGLLLTTIPQHEAELRTLTAGIGHVEIYVQDNRGRDIAPFLRVLNSGALAGYDAVLKLHTKRSPHLLSGARRRRLLYTALAGNRLQVERVLARFDAPDTGVVGFAPSYRDTPFYWWTNKPRVTELCARMQPPAPVACSFFEGSMFWFRPMALEPLRRLDLASEDFEVVAGQLDGGLHHAVERVFNLAAAAAGYNVLSDSGRLLFSTQHARATVS
jgi:rhamnosyltransferase